MRMPDWSGQWELASGAPNASGGFEQSLDEVLKTMQWGAPNKPEVQAAVDQFNAMLGRNFEAVEHGVDPGVQAGPICTFGFPAAMIDSPLMFEILPAPKETVLIYSDREIRHVYTDGRAHTPKDELWATPWGDSIGYWEGQTLVVDTIAVKSGQSGFPPAMNPVFAVGGGGQQLDRAQVITYLSPEAQFIERIRMVDKDHLEDQITIIDPANLTGPWHLTRTYRRVAHVHRMIYEDCEGENRNPIVNGHYTLLPPPSERQGAPAPPSATAAAPTTK
jgi:hypothetical protein